MNDQTCDAVRAIGSFGARGGEISRRKSNYLIGCSQVLTLALSPYLNLSLLSSSSSLKVGGFQVGKA